MVPFSRLLSRILSVFRPRNFGQVKMENFDSENGNFYADSGVSRFSGMHVVLLGYYERIKLDANSSISPIFFS